MLISRNFSFDFFVLICLGISTFAKGYGPNNDPLKGYILVFVTSLTCVLIGNLDFVSSLLSNFFVASYAMMNFAVFHASFTNTPGWRPSFKVSINLSENWYHYF